MLNCVVVSIASTELLESTCPFCHQELTAGDIVVQCPSCGQWHHVACWRDNEDRCTVHECSGGGQVQDRSPEPLPDEPIEIVEDFSAPVIDQLDLSGEALLNDIVIATVESEPILLPWIDVEDSATSPDAFEMISVDNWELALNKAVKQTKLDKFLQKIGLHRFLRNRVKGEHYFAVLGIILLAGMVVLFALITTLLILLANM